MDEETNVKVVEAAMTGFEEFKTTNDKRLKEIEAKGAADPVLEATSSPRSRRRSSRSRA
jgi:hypothetical protein